MSTALETPGPREVADDVLDRLEAAWNSADGDAFGALYTADATFVTVRGERFVGAHAIGAGHAGIFASVYAGSVNRMRLLTAAPVADGVLVAVSENTLSCPAGPLAGEHRAMSTSVLTRQADGPATWRIVATHNTLERL